MTPAWVAIISFVGGSAITLAVEWIRTLNARADRSQDAIERRADRDAERNARATERAEVRAAEHRERQRITLTELQDCLSEWLRAMGRAEATDRTAWTASGQQPGAFRAIRVDDELDELLNRLQRRVMVLSQRLDSEAVRQGVGACNDDYVAMVLAKTLTETVTAMTNAGNHFMSVNALIGQELRELSK